jgi:hypothetical protein
MQTRDAIKIGIDTAQMVCMAYLSDLSDAELFKRPHLQCNHLNWQVGHLINSEYDMLKAIAPAGLPELPAGFAAKYQRENAVHDDPSRFCTKDELMATYQTVRQAALTALANVPETDWEKETGISYAPTIAAMFTMIGAHWMMHCGQWVIVRRQLGKPVVI